MRVREEDGVDVADLVAQRLLPQVGRRVDEDVRAAGNVDVNRRTKAPVPGIGRTARRAVAADHRDAVRRPGAQHRHSARGQEPDDRGSARAQQAARGLPLSGCELRSNAVCVYRRATVGRRRRRSVRCAMGRGRRNVRSSSRPGTRGPCCTASVFTALCRCIPRHRAHGAQAMQPTRRPCDAYGVMMRDCGLLASTKRSRSS